MADETLSKGIAKMTDKELDRAIKRCRRITNMYKPDPFIRDLMRKLLAEKALRGRTL